MPVDRAAYRAWDGAARPSAGAVLVSAGAMIRRILRLKLVRWLLGTITIGVCVFSSVIFTFMREGRANRRVAEVLERLGYEQGSLLAWANRSFWTWIGFWAVLVAALTGTRLIAEDRRAKALPLYFSRPVTLLDYVLGKALTAAFFLAVLLCLPPVLMYVIDTALSPESVAVSHLPILGRSLLPGLVAVAVLGSLALGVSALCEKPSHAAFLFLGLLFVAHVMLPRMLAEHIFDNNDWLAISPVHCAHRFAIELLEVPAQVDPDYPGMRALGFRWAAIGATLWTALGFGLLVSRIRTVEVVG